MRVYRPGTANGWCAKLLKTCGWSMMEIILLNHQVEWLFLEHLYQVLGIVVAGAAILMFAAYLIW
jgi:hypothetical protein